MFKRILVVLAVLAAGAAFAQSTSFRQRIRHLTVHGEVWLRDDGSVVTTVECLSDPEQELVDGDTWPLKVRSVQVDGGMPNAVLNTCARNIEAANRLDGGVQ